MMAMSNPDFKSYFNTPLFSDATIAYYNNHHNTGGTTKCHTIPVHRLILSLHSSFFAAAFSFSLPAFRESQSGPDQNLITLHDDDPDALISAIRWCYGYSLYQMESDEELETQLVYCRDLITMRFTSEEEKQVAGLLLHLMRVYVVADKYDFPKLRGEVVGGHYERLAPLLLLHKQGAVFEEMAGVVYGLGKGDKLRKRFLGDVAREVVVYPVVGPVGGKEDSKERVKRGLKGGKVGKKEWEMEEVERIVRGCIFKIRTVGMGREWKREFMRDMKREVRRVVKKRWRGVDKG